MNIGVPGETVSNEERVALVPSVAEELISNGHDIRVVAGIGETADLADDAYEASGCTVVSNREEVFEQSDIILQVRALGATDNSELDTYRENQVVIGLLGPYDIDATTLETLGERRVSAFSLELIPRISRAQSMDALSSMASLGGYKAALVAAEELPKMFPLEMTAAGTIRPAEVFVIGAGVAGLKTIATAERLGASVRAYDIRLEVKQEVESLGADFVELDLETEGSGDDEGYATEMGEKFLEQQRKELTRVVADSDVVITTAAIPGRPAPELVTTEMIEDMDAGSVIVDLSAASGGNCEPTVADERVEHEGVTILGPTDLPSTVTHTASEQIANNMKNFIQNMTEDGTLTIDTSDEIVDSTLLTHDGEIRNPHIDSDDDESEDSPADDIGANEEEEADAE
jgi:NAD(P) transhydrogenase subunit alpha